MQLETHRNTVHCNDEQGKPSVTSKDIYHNGTLSQDHTTMTTIGSLQRPQHPFSSQLHQHSELDTLLITRPPPPPPSSSRTKHTERRRAHSSAAAVPTKGQHVVLQRHQPVQQHHNDRQSSLLDTNNSLATDTLGQAPAQSVGQEAGYTLSGHRSFILPTVASPSSSAQHARVGISLTLTPPLNHKTQRLLDAASSTCRDSPQHRQQDPHTYIHAYHARPSMTAETSDAELSSPEDVTPTNTYGQRRPSYASSLENNSDVSVPGAAAHTTDLSASFHQPRRTRSEPSFQSDYSDVQAVANPDANTSLPSSGLQRAPLGGLLASHHYRVVGNERLPLSPLEEVTSPSMTIDSPADLAEPQDPFNRLSYQQLTASQSEHSSVAGSSAPTSPDEKFYHSLLELVKTEEGYLEDLNDMVEVHFSLLSFARFITDEQRSIIVRNATALLAAHQRLQTKLQRVDEDLGWIRDHEEQSPLGYPTTTHRFKSSKATILDAARRISSIFHNESKHLSEIYQPFCSAHAEAMEIVKMVSTNKLEWNAFEAQCTSHLAQRKSSSTRLHFADFLIKPVQRICRYPLLFNSLLKHAPPRDKSLDNDDLSKSLSVGLKSAFEAFKRSAAEVDEAQKNRNLEIATVKLALRMDILHSDTASFLSHVGRVKLIGSGHVIHTSTSSLTSATTLPPSQVKAAFYGLVLYDTHLVMLRAKKTKLYYPKHWLPLRLYDLQVVPDGEGLLPYAIRMISGDHVFEIGSLCHQEQAIWASAIEKASYACQTKWMDSITSNPIAPPPFDETTLCSENMGSTPNLRLDTTSSTLALSQSTSALPSATSPDSATSPPELPESNNGISVPMTLPSSSTEEARLIRPRLSLRPPAQRVAVDLRLADLLSDSIMSARALSKRSHAMPLHGPPPRSMSQPSHVRSPLGRPHSFHSNSFGNRVLVDPALSSGRNSFAEFDVSSATGPSPRPPLQPVFSSSTTLSSNSYGSASQSPVTLSPTLDTNNTIASKLRRSKTSVQVSDMVARHVPQRTSTLSRFRRRATSLAVDEEPVRLIEELRKQKAANENLAAPPRDSVDGEAPATVARNSSTSSSSSNASTVSTKDSNSNGHAIETPQSSLPASPLLTPIDLESSHRWTKLGDALTSSLTRKRSFASHRVVLSAPQESSLAGFQAEQAQDAADYLYTFSTGRPAGYSRGHAHTSSVPSSSSRPHERRYSWDRVAWSGKSSGTSLISNQPASKSYTNMSFGSEKRQTSSSSLWSLFKSESTSLTSSPTPSVYESAHEEDESPSASSTTLQYTPITLNPHKLSPAAVISSPGPVRSTLIKHSSADRAPASKPQTLSPPPANSHHSGSSIKRKNSLSARIRAFKALGSSMTPLASPAAGAK